jgi:hypothetical protein
MAMPFKPNFRFERAERDRLKKAKKEEKLKRQQERIAQRRETDSTAPTDRPDPPEG